MATISRLKPQSNSTAALLDARIPEPFPVHVLREQQTPQDAVDNVGLEVRTPTPPEPLETQRSSIEVSVESCDGEVAEAQSRDLLPSIVYVQQSCLMTLNNLFLGLPGLSDEWQPILPSRRHSMPHSNAETHAASSSSALHTIVSNLRNAHRGQMLEVCSSSDDAALVGELQKRVDALASDLSMSDAGLARALTTLIAHTHRLSVVDHKSFGLCADVNEPGPSTRSAADPRTMHSGDPYADLTRQLSDLQLRRSDSELDIARPGTSPALAVEVALLWTKIDEELETVLTLCRQRTEPAPPHAWSTDHAPPEYDAMEQEPHFPPEYEFGLTPDWEQNSLKRRASITSFAGGALSEKMRLDLDAVTMAIDRLYLVAPQLHNQRVELKSGKLEELERARLAGPSVTKSKSMREGKAKENDLEELEKICEMIGKASSRRMEAQSATMDGKRLEKARQRDTEKRAAFVEQLLHHSRARRLHSQDAVLQTNKIRNPDTLLTLPDFLREQVPDHLQDLDPEALLTLPEFVKEPPPPKTPPLAPVVSRFSKRFGKSRSRSLSAPPLAWLLPHRSKSSQNLPMPADTVDADSLRPSTAGLTVRYVAEHHENLHHVLMFLGVEGMPAGVDLEAEVSPGTSDTSGGDKLILRCGVSTSPPLSLPVRVVPGKKDVRVQSGHYEVKLATLHPDASTTATADDTPPTLLDAPQLAALTPTAFICASCSLPLVQAPELQYHDLPSEHWAELLDAWMCHSDQKLHARVARHGTGFWPSPGQALVGGSYVLFDKSVVVRANMRGIEPELASNPPLSCAVVRHARRVRLIQTARDEGSHKVFVAQGDDWQRVGCICGAIVGRCQKHASTPESAASLTYRFAKYALRPVSPTADVFRVPFSAFILEDMIELKQAHASHRFLILDEQEERPRLLVWLFKPSMRLSYATTAQYVLPKSGSIHAAKVLFKILGPDCSPSEVKSILEKHAGFPQAERLLYPIDICRRLASLLKESNTAYPIGMRVMTGLLVGWLHRS